MSVRRHHCFPGASENDDLAVFDTDGGCCFTLADNGLGIFVHLNFIDNTFNQLLDLQLYGSIRSNQWSDSQFQAYIAVLYRSLVCCLRWC